MEWHPPIPPGYNDSNRAFLQALMARGTLTFGEGQRLIAAIYSADEKEDMNPASVDMDKFKAFLHAAREAIHPLDFDIRNMQHQIRKEQVWAFINSISDPATQLGTTHTAEEILFVKRLLDAMFDTYNTPRMEVMAVDEAQALKVSRPARPRQSNGNALDELDGAGGEGTQVSLDKGLKHSEVLALLASLVAEGWLEKSRADFYFLSPRALMELGLWLVETYNDPDAEDEWQRIKNCEACKEIVTIGQRCAEKDCAVRIHDICADAYWRSRKGIKKCPKCENDWTGKNFVGERAVTSTQAYSRSHQGRKGKRRSALDEVMAAQEEADKDDDGE